MAMKKPSGTKGAFGLPFLQADDLKKGEQTIEVLGVKEAPAEMEYSDYLVTCKIGKREYVLGVKDGTSTYEILFKKFGADESKWKGTITVRPRYSRKYENGFVDVLD